MVITQTFVLIYFFKKNNNELSIYEAQLAVVESFYWIRGKKRVLISDKMLKKNVAWMNAWIPENNDEHAIFLHDNGLKVSPDYYLWLVNALQRFQNSSYIYGATLNAKARVIDREFINDTVFVSQLDYWIGFVVRAEDLLRGSRIRIVMVLFSQSEITFTRLL